MYIDCLAAPVQTISDGDDGDDDGDDGDEGDDEGMLI